MTTRNYTNSQNLIILFDYSWFLAKNLSNLVSLPWEPHNWYCHRQEIETIHAMNRVISFFKSGLNILCSIIIRQCLLQQKFANFTTVLCKTTEFWINSTYFWQLFWIERTWFVWNRSMWEFCQIFGWKLDSKHFKVGSIWSKICQWWICQHTRRVLLIC